MSRNQARQLEFSPNALVDLRRVAGYTQEQLARELGVGLRTVTRWEAGVGQPVADTLLELARLLHADPGDFYVPVSAAS